MQRQTLDDVTVQIFSVVALSAGLRHTSRCHECLTLSHRDNATPQREDVIDQRRESVPTQLASYAHAHYRRRRVHYPSASAARLPHPHALGGRF